MAKMVSAAEMAKHSVPGDLWMAIDGDVYNVSKFAKLHPGGAAILEQYAGTDVSSIFYELHRKDVLNKYTRLKVGRLEGSPEEVAVLAGDISAVPFYEIPAI